MKAYVGLVGLLAAAVAASPTRVLDKRAEPSSYPGSGTECTNEMKYLNFDMKDDGDKKRVEKIHDAFCNDLPRLLKLGLGATQNDETVFQRYFNKGDESEVQSVFSQLWSGSSIQPLVKTFIVDNEDFLEICGEGGDASDGSDDGSVIYSEAGYTGEDEDGDGLEKTKFCDASFDLPSLDSIGCDSLDDYPTIAMDSFGRIMLHEFTHFDSVGSGSEVGSRIVDSFNADGEVAYQPDRAHALKSEKDDLVTGNADNYAWLASVRNL